MVSMSPNIGKIAGITIQLHWTFLALILLAFLFLFTSTQGLFLFVLIVLLFVCVLIHELAHSIVSKRNGIKVKKIVLLPIGGASVIDLHKVSPKVEMKIAVWGPLASILLGIAFYPLYLYAPAGLLKEGLLFLFEINLLLGLFNLLPGFPLDGGRVLRSYLQGKHDYYDATRIAVKVSYAVLLALVAGTIIYAALLVNGTIEYRELVIFWDVLIALFLYEGARAEMRDAQVRFYTSRMSAGDMVSKNYILVTKATKINELYRQMVEKGSSIVLLKSGKRVMALSARRIGMHPENTKSVASMASLFSTSVPEVSYREQLSSALDMMRTEEINTAVVMKKGKVDGILFMPYLDMALQMYLSDIKKGRGPQPSAKAPDDSK